MCRICMYMNGVRLEYPWNEDLICTENAQLPHPAPWPTLMPLVCRLCVVSAAKKRGSILASSCGGERAGNVHGVCVESA